MMLSGFIRFLLSAVPLAILVSSYLFPAVVQINTFTIIILMFFFLPFLGSFISSMKVTNIFEVVTIGESKSKVETPSQVGTATQTRPTVRGPHDYLVHTYASAMVKLVPVEMIAAFLVLQGQVSSLQVDLPNIGAVDLSFVLFFALLIATPLYLWRAHLVPPVQLAASTLAFAVWIFAIGGPFAKLPWYSSLWGGLALLIFMTIAPLIVLRR